MHAHTDEKEMLSGSQGHATKKSMEILVALGEIYGAKRMVPVTSVQVSGVSYKNLGDAGIEFLSELAEDGRARVKTTLNPAGMDLTNWKLQGINSRFASKQLEVIDAYRRLGLEISCTCTPYLAGNEPGFREHIAWGESSAVVYANSVLGARTNREGGPSALAASLTGRTPLYGYHLDENRVATLMVDVGVPLNTPEDFAAMGYSIGKVSKNGVPYFGGVREAGVEESKELSAALASSGGVAMFHIAGVTPEAGAPPSGIEVISFGMRDLNRGDRPAERRGRPRLCLRRMPSLFSEGAGNNLGATGGAQGHSRVLDMLQPRSEAPERRDGLLEGDRAERRQVRLRHVHGRRAHRDDGLQGGRDQLGEGLSLPEKQRSPRPVPDPREVRHGGDEDELKLKGRVIYSGEAEGDALVTSQPISFYGGVDPDFGRRSSSEGTSSRASA